MKTGYVTDIGQKKTNQDSMLLVRAETSAGEAVLAIVCDGMGGLQKGELASAEVIRAFDEWFQFVFPQLLDEGRRVDPNRVFSTWDRIIQEKNQQLIKCGQRYGIQTGTTIAGLLVVKDQYFIVNVGDSRIYQVMDSGIRCLTKDHSLVMQEVERGRLRPEEMEHDSRRNILLQCIGASGSVEPDYLIGTVTPGSVFMLCCDGFRHEITSKEFYNYLKPEEHKTENRLQEQLNRLLEMNLNRGEKDNITAIGIYIDE